MCLRCRSPAHACHANLGTDGADAKTQTKTQVPGCCPLRAPPAWPLACGWRANRRLSYKPDHITGMACGVKCHRPARTRRAATAMIPGALYQIDDITERMPPPRPSTPARFFQERLASNTGHCGNLDSSAHAIQPAKSEGRRASSVPSLTGPPCLPDEKRGVQSGNRCAEPVPGSRSD